MLMNQLHCPAIPTEESATEPSRLTISVSTIANELVSIFCTAIGKPSLRVTRQNGLSPKNFVIIRIASLKDYQILL